MTNVNVNTSFLNNLKEMITKCCNSKCCDDEPRPLSPLPVVVSLEAYTLDQHIKKVRSRVGTPEINQGNPVIELGGSPS